MADGKSLEEALALAKATEKTNEAIKKMKEGFAEVGAELFSLSVNDFFKQIPKSEEELKGLKTKLRELNGDLLDYSQKLSESFTTGMNLKQLKDNVKNLFEDATGQNKVFAANLQIAVEEAIKLKKNVDIAKFIRENGEESLEFLKTNFKINENFIKQAENIAKTELEIQGVNKQLEETNRLSFSISNAMKAFVERNFSLEKITQSIKNFDEGILQTQRATGIEMNKNSFAMAQMSVEAAKFGVSSADLNTTMGSLGDALNTTNFGLLSKAAEDTMMISRATGLSAQEINQLTGNFMLAGKSSKSVADFTEKAMMDSAKFGLNVKKVLEDVNKNYVNFRKLGFQGGEESLKRMVITAQKLRMNVDEIFNVAQRARSIEGAMEMAAELQLAGGSFAQIDPMQLLAAARKSPEELTKILGKMGQDIGKFNKETGEVEFDPVDADRLAMVAQATGLTVESLQNQITKGKQRIEKEGKGLFSGFAGGLDSETKDMLDQFSTLGADGQIKFEGAFAGMDINELRGLTQAEIQQKIKDYNKNKKSLEEQAKQNAAFTESLNDLITSFMGVFNVFQPILNKLTQLFQYINSMAPAFKAAIVIGVAALLTGFSPISMIARGVMMGKGFAQSVMSGGLFKTIGDKMKGMFSFGGGATAAGGATQAATMTATGTAGATAAPGLQAYAQAARTAAPAIAALGVALLGLGAGIGAAAFGLSYLTDSFAKLTGEQILGALGALAITMIGFTVMVVALGKAGMVASTGLIPLGVAFLMIGAGIGIAAAGMSLLVESFSKLDAKSLSSVGDGLFNFAKGLGALALASIVFGNPITLITFGLMIGALGSLSLVMSTLGPSLEAGGKGINAMATGVEKLSTALSKISDDTLDKLKSIGESIGDAAALTAAVNALNTATSGGGGGGTPQKFQIEVIVKGENGRELQRRIVKDTDLIK
jgi:hypothetical protein